VGSEDNNIYALDANNGVLLWEYVTGGLVESSAAVSDGVVYIGSNDGNVYAFGLKPSENQAAKDSKRPTFKTLRPDFNLRAVRNGEPSGSAITDEIRPLHVLRIGWEGH
jgi:outer membrane protein assembly factor BamB